MPKKQPSTTASTTKIVCHIATTTQRPAENTLRAPATTQRPTRSEPESSRSPSRSSLYDRLVGSVFLAAATIIGVGRVSHYPADVAAGVLVGLACALLVARLARPLLVPLVRLTERLTDPLISPLWRAYETALGARR